MNFDFPTRPTISVRKRRKPGININEFKKIKIECEEIENEFKSKEFENEFKEFENEFKEFEKESKEFEKESKEFENEFKEFEKESKEFEKESKEFEKESKEFELYCNETLPPLCHCITCYEYMGESNPRQYCNKTHCLYDGYSPTEVVVIQLHNLEASPYYNDPMFIHYPEYHDKIQSFIDNI